MKALFEPGMMSSAILGETVARKMPILYPKLRRALDSGTDRLWNIREAIDGGVKHNNRLLPSFKRRPC